MIVRRQPITYEHDVIMYVPVFQEDFNDKGELLFSPTFVYSMAHATDDEQMAWSLEPDYVFELRGHFKATTKPLVIKDDE